MLRITDVLARVRTESLPNVSLKRYPTSRETLSIHITASNVNINSEWIGKGAKENGRGLL
jgi:hypothetical protein